MDVVYALIGLAILLLAGDALVRGAVALSLRLGIPALIVGLTVVAFGTSSPELLITIQAAVQGVPGIAIGNVVGSNIANVLLVLGLPALFTALDPSASDCRRSYIQMIAASLALIGLAVARPLHFWEAGVLLTLFALMLLDAIRESRRSGRVAAAGVGVARIEPSATQPAVWKMIALLAAGLIGLPLGAQLLIDGAIGVSRAFGVSEEVIGLTLVAVGTSLPELATTLMAALRKQADVAIGNVIGSNLFNILAILGIASLFGPIPVDAAFLRRDLWVMLGAAALLAPFVLAGWRIGRIWGGLFLSAYVLYTVVLFLNGGSAA